MFKKKPLIKTLSPLRSSDRRKLADQIIKDFHLQPDIPSPPQDSSDAAPDEADNTDKSAAVAAHAALRNSLLPEHSLFAKFTTTSGPNLTEVVGTVYVGSYSSNDQRVLWVSISPRLYPSVYTLWKNPGIIPLLHTPSVVVQKLRGGADLMTPGLAGPPFPPKATKNSLVAIASLENPSVPLAVGICQIDIASLKETRGAKGVAVESFHWEGDELWKWSAAGKAGAPAPDALDGWITSDEDELIAETQDLSLDNAEAEGGVTISAESEPTEKRDTRNGYVSGEDAPFEEIDAPEEQQLTTKEIDEAFRSAFLYGVYHHKTTYPSQSKFGLTFPLSQSVVMSSLVLPFLPTFTQKQTESLVIKKTSWKTIRKFIKSLDKEKLILAKDRPGNEVDVLDIDFDDRAFLQFQPYPLPKKATKVAEGTSKASSSETADDSVGQKLKKLEYLRPKDSLSYIFKASNVGSKSLYTSSELRTIITDYLESENLISPQNKRLVKLNPQLSSTLFDPSTSANDSEILAKGAIPRDTLIDRIIHSYCAPYHSIQQETSEPADPTAQTSKAKAKAGPAPKLGIVHETRSGNKTVTRIHGLEPFHIRAQALADELRKTCASSTSVEPLKGGKPGTLEVMVQGPQKDAVLKALERRGVNKQWVDYTDKTKGKGKGGSK